MEYAQEIQQACKQMEEDIKIYTLQKRNTEFFFSDIRMTARDDGKNLCAVVNYFIERGCRFYLALAGQMLKFNWDGNLENIPEPIRNGEKYLLRLHLI